MSKGFGAVGAIVAALTVAGTAAAAYTSPKLQVSFDTHKLARQGRITRKVDLQNVVALLPGKSPRRISTTL